MEPLEAVQFRRLLEFNNAGHNYIQTHEDERSQTTFALNKLLAYYHKVIKKIQDGWQDELNELTEDIRVKYCEKEDGIFKEKSYGEGANLITKKVFKADNEVKANKEIKALAKRLEEKWMGKEIDDIKIHIVPVPSQLNISWVRVFEGFIYEPMTEEALEAHHLAQGKKEKKEPVKEPVIANGQE